MSSTDSMNQHYFSPIEMMAEAEKFALSKAKKSSAMTLGLAVMAGAFIGLAFLFYITVTTGSANTGWGISRFAGGLAFSMGLIFIVIGGGELFTSSVLSSISWANKQISFGKMLSIWAKVYLGNFIGAMGLLLIVTAAGLYQLDDGQWGLNALNIAQHKLHHTTLQAFALGVLCNLLVCLAIWLTFSSANAMTKAAMTVLPVAMFVSSGFEHCVANMFMVPLGIVIQLFAPESFWQQIGTNPADYADLNVLHFITANLIPVTVGNIIGGSVLVGLANWAIYRRPQLKAANITTITRTTPITPAQDTTMNSTITMKDIMATDTLVFHASTLIPAAIDLLIERQVSSAPVVDQENRLVGMFSVHDVLVELWCQNYIPAENQKVVDLMSREVIAIDVNDKLVDVAEFLCIDREQLFPTTSAGIAIRFSTLSLEERAKSMKINQPHHLPVLDNGYFAGMVSRHHVLEALRPIYGERMSVVDPHAKDSKIA